MHYIIESLRDGHRAVAYHSDGNWSFIGTDQSLNNKQFQADWAVVKELEV